MLRHQLFDDSSGVDEEALRAMTEQLLGATWHRCECKDSDVPEDAEAFVAWQIEGLCLQRGVDHMTLIVGRRLGERRKTVLAVYWEILPRFLTSG